MNNRRCPPCSQQLPASTPASVTTTTTTAVDVLHTRRRRIFFAHTTATNLKKPHDTRERSLFLYFYFFQIYFPVFVCFSLQRKREFII